MGFGLARNKRDRTQAKAVEADEQPIQRTIGRVEDRAFRRTRDRRLRAAKQFLRFSPTVLQLRLLPRWVLWSLTGNGTLAIVVLLLLWRSFSPSVNAARLNPAANASNTAEVATATPGVLAASEPGIRHQLTYQQWVDLLAQEAKVTATQKPTHLSILAGDSISLWFPQTLLPQQRHWLNQGISGETSAGLLKRLDLFDETKPETIFVMIGINDLIKGVDDNTLLDHQEEIVRSLRDAHPKAQIVLQSILPHGGAGAKWEGRDRLRAIPETRIQDLNQELEAIARQEGVYFLDLYSLFTDAQGDLRADLSTDGLHLNAQGYQVWSIALQVYSREVLEPDYEKEKG
jgi:lysophospholipase L1-like esterase